MGFRLLVVFLVATLVWSGFSTIEAPTSAGHPAPGQHHACADPYDPCDTPHGSVEDHHLDDLPSQTLSDPPAEPPALLQATGRPGHPDVPHAMPHPYRSAATGTPLLAGPLRPPARGPIPG